jgi:hypothetical protein
MLLVLWAALLPGHALAAAPAPPVRVWPAPGAVLTSAPHAVTIRFARVASGPVQLQVLDTHGRERAAPDVQRGAVVTAPVAADAPGLYTILWTDGGISGSSTFSVWRGGPLPPPLLRAAYGGTGDRPVGGFWLDLWTGLALAGAVLFLGRALAPTGRPARDAGVRRGALALAAGAVLATGERVAGEIGVGFPHLLSSPLLPALLTRGAAADALLAAGIALVAVVLPRPRMFAGGAAALALLLLLASLPPLLEGGVLPAWLAATGLALAASRLSTAPRRRGEPSADGRVPWLALALAGTGMAWFALLDGGLPRPAGTPVLLGAVTAGLALVCGALPRPSRRLAACGIAAALAGAALCGSGWTGPSPWAPIPWGAPRGAWAVRAGHGAAGLRLSSPVPGPQTLELLAPGARGRGLAVQLARVQGPPLRRTLEAVRRRPGVYVAVSDALSVPGTWQVDFAGQALRVRLGAVDAASCRSFVGRPDRWAPLGGPVLALVASPGAPNVALASTPSGVFATDDGGRRWVAAGDPGRATALAIDRYGQWWAATPAGLWTSTDGGVRWQPTAGVGGPASAVFTPLYPSGVPLWAVVAGSLWQRDWQLGFLGLTTSWQVAGAMPAGIRFALAVPPAVQPPSPPGPVNWQGQPVTLLAGGATGLWQTTSAAPGSWVRVLAAPLRAAAVGAQALWAVGPDGTYTASAAGGPWRRLPGAPGGSAVAVGAHGTDVFVAAPGAGLLESSDGGATWRTAGCPLGEVTALAGTFTPARPDPMGGAPTLYLADARGDVVALLPAG